MHTVFVLRFFYPWVFTVYFTSGYVGLIFDMLKGMVVHTHVFWTVSPSELGRPHHRCEVTLWL